MAIKTIGSDSERSLQLLEALLNAHATGAAISPNNFQDVIADCAQAYLLQQELGNRLGSHKDVVPRFWKSGGSSFESKCFHAPLPDARVSMSPSKLATPHLMTAGVEGEIAFRLGKRIDRTTLDEPTSLQIDGLFDSMAVSIEVIQSRWLNNGTVDIKLQIADMLSHGALVLGDWVPFTQRDWTEQVCSVLRNGKCTRKVIGSHPMRSPTQGLKQWLTHVIMNYGKIEAGTVVTTGSWIGVIQVENNDTVEVVFDGIGSATVSIGL